MHSSEAQIGKAISDHQTRNAKLREAFIAKGVDLQESRLIECHFWAPNKENATGLAAALISRGFRILVQRPAAFPVTLHFGT